MGVTATRTVRDIITQALRKARVTDVNNDPTAWDAKQARLELDDMLKEWQASGFNLWTWTNGSLALAASTAEFTLSPERPLTVVNVRYKSAAGTETMMEPMTRWEYDSLVNKSTEGVPAQFYYDRQREDARFYVYPVLASRTTETIEYTYQREVEDVLTINDTLDMPGEWWSAVVYGLASRLIDTYGLQNPTVQARAELLYNKQLAFDREGSVFFTRQAE